MKKIMSDDRGITLIELIVVVLIMGILATGASMSISSVYNANVDRAAKKICVLMGNARTKAVAKNEDGVYIKFKVFHYNDDLYAGVYKCKKVGGTETELELLEPSASASNPLIPAEAICNYKVSVYSAKKNKQNAVLVDEGLLEYRFMKSSGAIESVTVNGNKFATADGEDKMYLDIILSGSEEKRIIVVPSTGRCYLK